MCDIFKVVQCHIDQHRVTRSLRISCPLWVEMETLLFNSW